MWLNKLTHGYFHTTTKPRVKAVEVDGSIFLNVRTVPDMDFIKGMCDMSGYDSK